MVGKGTHRTKEEKARIVMEASLTGENNELKGIIGELTIANETLKKFILQRVGSHERSRFKGIFQI